MNIFRRHRAGFVFTALLWLTCGLHAQQRPATEQEATVVLRKVSARLSSLSRVSYHYRRELSYPSENYHHVLEGDVIFEFHPKELPIGAKYQVRYWAGFEVYNGSEILRGDAATRTIQMTPVRSAKELERASFLHNSFATLRRALPVLLGDATIAKSIVGRTGSKWEIDV